MTSGLPYEQHRRAGRALRTNVRRADHGVWDPPTDRPDPIALLERDNRLRLTDLVPIRYGRMLASPFAFLRGSVVIMASNLAGAPTTGLHVQACGDAHLGNFGVFGTPERNLVFDVNDFDETLPGPWEWDVKRLAASVVIAGRNLALGQAKATAIARAATRAYRMRMSELGTMGPLEVWYDRVDVATVLAIAREERADDLKRQLRVAKVRQRTSLRALPKLTRVVNGTRKIIDDPPLISHVDPETFDGATMIADYAQSLPPERRRPPGALHGPGHRPQGRGRGQRGNPLLPQSARRRRRALAGLPPAQGGDEPGAPAAGRGRSSGTRASAS